MLQRVLTVSLCTLLLLATAHAATVQLPRTGQTKCYSAAGAEIVCATDPLAAGQDGKLLKGAALPNPRFTDNNNGTVTDNLTGLVWLKNANCWGAINWQTALTNANALANGSCGLSDGSVAGDWRMPNIVELESLVDLSQNNPVIPFGHPFGNVQSSSDQWSRYWSSTSSAGDPFRPCIVSMLSGINHCLSDDGKIGHLYVWPVRGGQ